MAGKQSDDAPEEQKGGAKRMIVAGVAAVALVGAGYMIAGKAGGAAAPAADAAAEAGAEEEAEAHVEAVVDLDAVNVNLADGHYLRIAISLGMAEAGGGGGHGGGGDEVMTAPASDAVLRTLSGKTVAELSTTEGREAARESIMHELEHFYGHEVVAVYFTEFVTQ